MFVCARRVYPLKGVEYDREYDLHRALLSLSHDRLCKDALLAQGGIAQLIAAAEHAADSKQVQVNHPGTAGKSSSSQAAVWIGIGLTRRVQAETASTMLTTLGELCVTPGAAAPINDALPLLCKMSTSSNNDVATVRYQLALVAVWQSHRPSHYVFLWLSGCHDNVTANTSCKPAPPQACVGLFVFIRIAQVWYAMQSNDGEAHARFVLDGCGAQDLFVHLCRTSKSDEVLANAAAILACFASSSASAAGSVVPRHTTNTNVEQEIESLIQCPPAPTHSTITRAQHTHAQVRAHRQAVRVTLCS